MSAGGDFLAFGGAGAIYQPNELADYSGSAETATRPVLESDINYPFGQGGEGVIRRVYVTIHWEIGMSVTVTPFVDGVELTTFKQQFNRIGTGRETFMLALSRRGGNVRVKVEGEPPIGRWYLERQLEVHGIPLTASKPAART